MTILLVEANAGTRGKIHRYFAALGRVVFACETMEQADRLLREHGDQIDHFLFDLVKAAA